MNMSKEMNFVSAIVYLNNANAITDAFIRTIAEVFSENFLKYEIICVDDNIGEECNKMLQKIKVENDIEALTVIHMAAGRKGIQGREHCMVAGRDIAIGDYIFEFDNPTMDYMPLTIMEAYFMSQKGYDIVSVSREGKSRISSYFFYKLYNKFSKSPNKLDTETFRVLSRRAINRVESYSKTMPYRKAVYSFSGLAMTTIKYKSNTRQQQVRDLGRWDTASDAIILFTNFAYKVALFLSVVMAVFMFVFGVYVVIVYFGANRPVTGWAPLMGVMCFGFLAVFILNAIVFKYLDMLIRLEFENYQYVVSSIDKF